MELNLIIGGTREELARNRLEIFMELIWNVIAFNNLSEVIMGCDLISGEPDGVE